MIVLDASVGAALTLNERPVATRAWDLLDEVEVIVVPGLFDLEVLAAIKGHERAGALTGENAEAALAALTDLPVVRWPHGDLRRRIFDLRHQFSVYDGAYVALAEALDVPLLTADLKLARSAAGLVDVQTVS